MVDIKDFINAEDNNEFNSHIKSEITQRVMMKLEDMKREMAKDYLKRDDDNESH
jgi:hypothetical protein